MASIPSTSNRFEILAQATAEPPPILQNSSMPSASNPIIPPPQSSPISRLPRDEATNIKEIQTRPQGNAKEMEVEGTTSKSSETHKENPEHPEGTSKAMETDDLQYQAWKLAFITEENSQVEHMEEEPESIDLKGLDIFGLEQACRKKEYDKIQEHQLSTLETILSRAYQQQQLGIQPGSQWDGNILPKDSKKRGRKTDLQQTIAVGKILVDSG